MKIEECKEVIHKCGKLNGREYTLEDKDILLNSIKILPYIDCFKCVRDDLIFKVNVCFTLGKISENHY